MPEPNSPQSARRGSTADRCVFFLPIYDQVRELPLVLEEIDAASLATVDYLLVNNGSKDGSAEIVHESRHPYIDVEVNRGIGLSYLLALEWAMARDYRYFGTMAANGKMLAAEIPLLLEPLWSGAADYVTGSRFLPGGSSPNLPSFRRRTIPFVNLLARLTTGAVLTDATNGFRAFKLDLLERARFDWHADWLMTYGLEYYLYAKVLRDSTMRAIEVPTTMRYPASGSYTKISPGADWWHMIQPWLRATMTPGFESE
jgi:dolichol-phosphate mannosyltransferase